MGERERDFMSLSGRESLPNDNGALGNGHFDPSLYSLSLSLFFASQFIHNEPERERERENDSKNPSINANDHM